MVRNITKIYSGEEVKNKLLKGSKKISEAVGTTFGPYGKNVALTMLYNDAHITKDGVTVANSINLEDPIENISAQIIKQAAAKTAEIAGDGTTSTTILSNFLVKTCFQYLQDFPNVKISEIKNYLEEISKYSIDIINANTSKIKKGDIKRIALVSSNGDNEIADLVTEAFETIGERGIVSVTESRSYDTSLEACEGIKLDRGHISPVFVMGRTKVKHNNCRILVTDCDIKGSVDIINLVNLQESIKEPILIICNDIDETAIKILAFNKEQRNIPIEVIRAPYIADARKEALDDLAIATGATNLSKNKGWAISQVNPDILGFSDSVEITTKGTNILGRKGSIEELNKRIKYYEEKIKGDTEGLKGNYKKRLGMLTAGAAVIYIGGTNETEIQEKKDRLDDTIRAVRSALEEGIVLGGALTYKMIEEGLKQKDIKTNTLIPYVAEELSNLVLTLIKNSSYPLDLDKHIELVTKGGIIDPALVITSTIKNAIGAVKMIISTDCVVVKKDI